MKVKVIGVNPIDPAKSGLLKEGDLTPETALRLSFKQPISIMQLRLIGEELVLYVGQPLDLAQYQKALEAAKQRIRDREGKNENV